VELVSDAVGMHMCKSYRIELCVSSLVKNLLFRNEESGDNSLFILSDDHVLLPTGNEDQFLYSSIRPNISAIRPIGYSKKRDGLLTVLLPESTTKARLLPIYITGAKSQKAFLKNPNTENPFWVLELFDESRMIRVPLFYDRNPSSCSFFCYNEIDILNITKFSRSISTRYVIPTDLGLYTKSSNVENKEKYEVSTDGTTVSAAAYDKIGIEMPLFSISKKKTKIMFLVPSFQIGGSEKSILDISRYLISQKNWHVTILILGTSWKNNRLGVDYLSNEWYESLHSLTFDVHDIISLSQAKTTAKLLRYFLETRNPDYIYIANSVFAYKHLPFITKISPNSTIVDYNHMIHMNWEPEFGKGYGGLPRLGSIYSEYIDLHLTASENVSASIKKWIHSGHIEEDVKKVKTCYIGADLALLPSDAIRMEARNNFRSKHDIPEESIVILFAGRFVLDKGIDILCESMKIIAQKTSLVHKPVFMFVGTGELKQNLIATKSVLDKFEVKMIIMDPSSDSREMGKYYAHADILLLPSRNEGIALVLYEAMASGLLVVSTNEGGQNELLNNKTGILLPKLSSMDDPAKYLAEQVTNIVSNFTQTYEIRETGKRNVINHYSTKMFCECVYKNIIEATTWRQYDDKKRRESIRKISSFEEILAEPTIFAIRDGLWNLNRIPRSVENIVTIGIKSFVCDSSNEMFLQNLIKSIRLNYRRIRIIIGNDGPISLNDFPWFRKDEYLDELHIPYDAGISRGRNIMVQKTNTPYFLLLDDDHLFDENTRIEDALAGLLVNNFDIVGLRVHNLPGIEERERNGINIPRYVATVSKFQNRKLTLCVWNENNGPDVRNLKVPVKVDVLHNAFIAKTQILIENPWKDYLKVNEHMTFFLDARSSNLNVGYLPSVVVHHRLREPTSCYTRVRNREGSFEHLLEYEDHFLWDTPCGNSFVEKIESHIESTKYY